MADTTNFETQPQIAQFEIKFNGPLIKDSQVSTFNDLLSLGFNYEHKIVWVIDQKLNYYLDDGDGSVSTNWKPLQTKSVIVPYVPTETYDINVPVRFGGKLYVALQTVPENELPSNNPTYWFPISSNNVSERYVFHDVGEFIFYTSTENPKFTVYLAEYKKDTNDDLIIPLNILSEEIVDVPVEKQFELPANNGIPYKVSFLEDSVLTTNEYSGYVIIY